MQTTSFLGVILLPILLAPAVYLVGRVFVRRKESKAANTPGYLLGVAALLACWWPYWNTLREFQTSGTGFFSYGLIRLQLDSVSLLLAGIVLVLSTLVMIFAGPYLAREDHEEKFYASLIAMTGAMIGLGFAADLFNLWLWFELMAISSYLLVAFHRQEGASLEAGIKYMMQSAAGSMLVLLGVAVVLAVTGTLSLAEIRAFDASPMLLGAGALFLVGFGVKAALVPLHTWLPDAHSQAPSPISAMLSGVVIEAGLVAMLRVLGALSRVTTDWGMILMMAGAINMLYGNLMALRQTQVKRMLAYSSLSQVGYILLGVGMTLYTGAAAGAAGGMFHLVTHGLMKGLAFLAAGALLYALHLATNDHAPLTVSDLSGVSRRYPWVALTLSIALLALAGLPPFAGFMSKWQIFMAGVESRQTLIVGLVIFAALNSVLSLGYYIPLVNAMYRRQLSPAVEGGAAMPVVMVAPLVALAGMILVLGVWPGLLAWMTGPAGAALAGGWYGVKTMNFLLYPVFAFFIYMLVAALLSGLARSFAPSKQSAIKSSTYASGEQPPEKLAAPGYKPFFVVALFFAILHLGVLVVAMGDFSPAMAAFIVGLIIALLALILG